MEYPGNAFHTFLDLDSVIYLVVNGTVTSLPVFIQNILHFVPKKNKAFTGLEQHGGKWTMTWINVFATWNKCRLLSDYFTLAVYRPIHTAPTDVDQRRQPSEYSMSLLRHSNTQEMEIYLSLMALVCVKTSTDQCQQTPAGLSNWSDKTQWVCLLPFVGVCCHSVNCPYQVFRTSQLEYIACKMKISLQNHLL